MPMPSLFKIGGRPVAQGRIACTAYRLAKAIPVTLSPSLQTKFSIRTEVQRKGHVLDGGAGSLMAHNEGAVFDERVRECEDVGMARPAGCDLEQYLARGGLRDGEVGLEDEVEVSRAVHRGAHGGRNARHVGVAGVVEWIERREI